MESLKLEATLLKLPSFSANPLAESLRNLHVSNLKNCLFEAIDVKPIGQSLHSSKIHTLVAILFN